MKTILLTCILHLTLGICLPLLGLCTTLSAQTQNKNNGQLTNTTAPIIESGRLVATITNTVVHLDEAYRFPLFRNAKMNNDFSMEGEWVNSTLIFPDEPSVTTKVIKVEDDIATILTAASDRPPMPAVQVSYDSIRELKNMPHLTDGNTNWVNANQVMESLEDDKAKYLMRYTTPRRFSSPEELNRDPAYRQGILANDRHTSWYHSKIVDEYQALQVPITTEAPSGDNSSVVAVANALSYLYTKANTNPTQVSKSFLTWAHDSYPLNDSQLNTTWRPNDHVDPNKIEEGQRTEHQELAHFLHPEIILVPVTSGAEHRIDLGRLLKAVQRFGVALESEKPSNVAWTTPSPETRDAASDRAKNRPVVVRCFNSWNDSTYLRKYDDPYDMTKQEDIQRALYFSFVTKEVTAGHPVIVTYLKETQPKSGKYIKRSYLITGSGNQTHHQSLQFLTPNGVFETYDYYARGNGEVLPQGPGNPLGRLREGCPFSRAYVGWNPQAIWKNVTYSQSDFKPSRKTSSYGADHKFEVYSLGFE